MLPTTFLHIISSNSASDIKLTPDHLIFSSKCGIDSVYKLVTASSVHVGDCLRDISGEVRVLEIKEFIGYGVYSAVVEDPSAFLVVSGLVASPFAINHQYTNYFYNIIRLLYRDFPVILNSIPLVPFFEKLSISLSTFIIW